MSNTQLSQANQPELSTHEKAIQLLRDLNECAKSNSNGTKVQVLTPLISKFIETNDKLNEKMVDHIIENRSIMYDSNTFANDVINFEVDGSRGRFANYLRAFSYNGAWSAYTQQFKGYKIPFITQKNTLQLIISTYRKIQNKIKAAPDGLEQHHKKEGRNAINSIIAEFETAYLKAIVKYNEINPDNLNLASLWKEGKLKLENLIDDPHRYHAGWFTFFNDQTTSGKLVTSMEKAIVLYDESENLKTRKDMSDNITNETIQESSNIRSSSLMFARRDAELKLLRNLAESLDDTEQLATIKEAEKQNVKAFTENVCNASKTSNTCYKPASEISTDNTENVFDDEFDDVIISDLDSDSDSESFYNGDDTEQNCSRKRELDDTSVISTAVDENVAKKRKTESETYTTDTT